MEWISIEDRLPKELEKIMLYIPNVGSLMGYFNGDCFFDEYYQERYKNVTHWMPLPNKPNVF